MSPEVTTFTPADEDKSRLGPAYYASERWAESVTAQLDESDIQPLIENISKEIGEKLWDAACASLLSDTECNAARAVRHMVEQTVEALLAGKEWAMQQYPYADYSRGADIRKAVAQHGGDELLMRRIADLEAELARKEETIKWLRR